MSPDPLVEAQELVGRRLGLDFSDCRGEAVRRRLQRALQSTASGDIPAALTRLAHLAPESPELLRFAGRLTVGETYFFRDRASFLALEHQVLPSLIAARRAAGLLQLRIWSAGCSTGEEPYSLALLLDRLLPDAANWRLTILATDINPDSLARAREGRFSEWSFRATPGWVREKYFRRFDARTYELAPRIRDRVRFQPLNLAEGAYPATHSNTTAMDLILCRNVLMYFTDPARRATVERLQRSLVPGGWLVVAPPEASAALLAPLQPVNMPGTILFQKVEPASSTSSREQPGRWPEWDSRRSRGVGAAHGMDVPVSSRACPRVDLTRPSESPLEQPRPSRPAFAAMAPLGTGDAEEGKQELLIRRARELADRGEVAEARALCEAAVRQDPLAVEPLLLLATLCDLSGEVGAAQVALRRALFLDPDGPVAQFALGTLLIRQGENPRGKRLLERVARLLETLPPSAPLEFGAGITAGDLLGRALRWLETN